MTTIEEFNEHIMSTYGRFDTVLESGSDSTAVDENGKEYIDFGSGIGTNSLGYCNDEWVEAICNQAKTIQHSSNYYYTKVSSDFAKKLCDITGYKKLFFGNSGAEANECAIKLARKYSFDKYGKGRNVIVTLCNSFHGRTIATLSATGQDVFHNYFFPFVEGFVNAKANDIKDLKRVVKANKTEICAIMYECVQGEGGVVPLDSDFVKEINRICEKHDYLSICDEVQTGVGRTGTFLASENYSVKPNITTLAKGLAGGVPIGACLADEKCCDVLSKGTHGSTFGGNPISCAGGIAVLDQISKNDFLDEVKTKGEYFKNELLKIDEVAGVDGLGMMIGIRLKHKKALDVASECLNNGLLVLTAKEKVRLLPPLTITKEKIDKGMKIFKEILDK